MGLWEPWAALRPRPLGDLGAAAAASESPEASEPQDLRPCRVQRSFGFRGLGVYSLGFRGLKV